MIRDNKPFPRKQADGKQEEYSEASALRFDPAEDKARQEFKDEADINLILQRHGVKVRADGMNGDTDYTIDLQQAIASVDEARRLRARLPEDIQAKYATWQEVMQAASSGELAKDLDRSDQEKQRRRQERRQQLEEEAILQAEIERDRKRRAFERELDNPSKKVDTRDGE